MDFVLSQMRERVGRRVEWAQGTTDQDTRINDAINSTWSELYHAWPYPEVVDAVDITVLADSFSVALPQVIDQVLRVAVRDSGVYIPLVSRAQIARRQARLITGLPTMVAQVGSKSVYDQPDAPAQIGLRSTNPGDVSQTIQVEGTAGIDTATLIRFSSFVTLNGTNLVSTPAATPFSHVVLVTKDSDTAGTVIVSDATAAVDIGAIGSDDRYVQYPWIRFDRGLSADTVMSITFRRKIRLLRRDDDAPSLPTVGEILIEGAYGTVLKQQRDFTKAQIQESKFQKMLADYIDRRGGSDQSREIIPDPNWLAQR